MNQENHGVLAVGIKEAARMLGVCPRTVANLIETRELISRKIGRRRVIQVSVLEAFVRRDHEVPKRKPVESAKPTAAKAIRSRWGS